MNNQKVSNAHELLLDFRMDKLVIWFMGSALLTTGYHSRSLQTSDKEPVPKPLDVLQFGKTEGKYLMRMQEWKLDKQTCFTRKWLRKFESTKEDEMCAPEHIWTNYCYGTCNSLYLPQPNNQAFKLCKACTPTKGNMQQKVVFLKCRKRKGGQKTVQLISVKQIQSCGCSKVDCNK